VDLARDLIRLSGLSEDDVKIEFTGLRPGEKLYEELLADDESTLPTPHPKLRIMKADAPPSVAWAAETVRWLETSGMPAAVAVRAGLAARIPEYQPARNAAPSESQAATASSTPMSTTSRLVG